MKAPFRSAILTLVMLAAPAFLAAQQSRGSISGRVTDEASGQPLSNVAVVVAGTTLGARTNAEGRYSIANVPTGTQLLRVNRLGYAARTRTVTVVAGAPLTADFTLAHSAVALDEVVVTGTAGASERRSQPAVVATVDASKIVETGVVGSVQDVLAARVPGVQVNMSSGSSGTSQQIRIRGASSISLSNEPLVFIDGVRADSRAQMVTFTGGQANSRLFDINPEDIESIEVVKGPAAATLYGADASAGVIQIITKKGRAGANRFSQTLGLEYNDIDPNFTPLANFGTCSATQVKAGSGYALCEGLAAGTVVSDNPLQRTGAFRNGTMQSVAWSARGGGDSYGYFVSLNSDTEEGTLPSNAFSRKSGRVNFNFTPASRLAFDAGIGIYRTRTNLPHNDNNVYGFLGGGYLGRPTLGNYVKRDADGKLTGGFYSANREVEAISSIENLYGTMRFTPSITVNYTPFDWFSNRLVVGADVSNGEITAFFPKNDKGWYQGSTNTGSLQEHRTNNTIYTIDYLGRLQHQLRAGLASTLSIGAQIITQQYDRVTGSGTGFVTNANRVVSSAAEISASQDFSDDRSVGLLAQGELAWQDRLFLQLGARLDQNSSFGKNADPFFLPKLGASYVVSEEGFWAPLQGAIPTLRLRAAWGTTGRSPTAGASLETYNAQPFAILAGGSAAGVIPLNPGNTALRPERGEEFEAGFDAGFFGNRLGAEVTFFNKTTTDLLLRRPIPPSSGFSQNPFVNIGKVLNRGWEYAIHGTLIDAANLEWTARVGGSTLKNELVDLGNIEPFGTFPRFEAGYPLGAYFTRTVRSVDTTANKVVVSKDLEYFGNVLPTNEGNAGTTVTLFRNLAVSAQVDWKRGFKIYNNTAQFRDRVFRNSEIGQRCTEVLGKEACLRRFGPFVSEEGGGAVSYTQVNGEYFETGDFVRLREVAATFTLPARFASAMRASSASLTVGGRNLGLWTNYTGSDPEVLSAATQGFARSDFLTVPQARRLVVRANLTF
ncbi:MAG: SusC/RagA family TonB-linked outer membrane protein [Gemmatimonadaceae bacterium]